MPSLATTTQGPLGCGSYSVQLVNAGQPILESKRTTSAVWGRRVDEASDATITLPVQGTDLSACCTGVNRIEPLRTEAILNRNGVPVWQGFVMNDVDIRRDNIIVTAKDILGWTERRTIKNDIVSVAMDLTDIALAYFGDVNAAGDLPLVITSELTGILADRTVLASEDRWASEVLKDLYDTGLDATVVAGHLLLGPETPSCGLLAIRDTDIDGDPSIKIDGRQMATRVVVKGANGIRVVWPATQPDVCILPADYVMTDESILDAGSALAAAQELYERLSAAFPYYVSIPQGSSLRSSAPVHINALIPGSLVQFTTNALCLPISMTMRLVALDVEASGESEQVRVTLEPLGGEFGDGA